MISRNDYADATPPRDPEVNHQAYIPDMLDDLASDRAKVEPQAARDWEAIKLVSLLKAERVTRGLSQAQIAERMGIPQPHVARIERRPWSTSFSRILAYAAAVGVSLSIDAGSPNEPLAA